MRISDWSSDVCSADLTFFLMGGTQKAAGALPGGTIFVTLVIANAAAIGVTETVVALLAPGPATWPAWFAGLRTEERRVGKEGVSMCRSRRLAGYLNIKEEVDNARGYKEMSTRR